MQVLAVSAHPDDETLGCGGTLLKHHDQGDELYWLIVTGTTTPQWSTEVIAAKEREVAAVAAAYGMCEYFWPRLPSTGLDALPLNSIISEIRTVLERVRPDVVYLVHGGDIHSDHQRVFQAATIVMKPFASGRQGLRRLLCFETLSSTDAAPPQPDRAFTPQVFSDITPYIERKLALMALFASEQQPDPLPRGPSAIRALARWRGASIGVDYAEAFMLIREVV